MFIDELPLPEVSRRGATSSRSSNDAAGSATAPGAIYRSTLSDAANAVPWSASLRSDDPAAGRGGPSARGRVAAADTNESREGYAAVTVPRRPLASSLRHHPTRRGDEDLTLDSDTAAWQQYFPPSDDDDDDHRLVAAARKGRRSVGFQGGTAATSGGHAVATANVSTDRPNAASHATLEAEDRRRRSHPMRRHHYAVVSARSDASSEDTTAAWVEVGCRPPRRPGGPWEQPLSTVETANQNRMPGAAAAATAYNGHHRALSGRGGGMGAHDVAVMQPYIDPLEALIQLNLSLQERSPPTDEPTKMTRPSDGGGDGPTSATRQPPPAQREPRHPHGDVEEDGGFPAHHRATTSNAAAEADHGPYQRTPDASPTFSSRSKSGVRTHHHDHDRGPPAISSSTVREMVGDEGGAVPKRSSPQRGDTWRPTKAWEGPLDGTIRLRRGVGVDDESASGYDDTATTSTEPLRGGGPPRASHVPPASEGAQQLLPRVRIRDTWVDEADGQTYILCTTPARLTTAAAPAAIAAVVHDSGRMTADSSLRPNKATEPSVDAGDLLVASQRRLRLLDRQERVNLLSQLEDTLPADSTTGLPAVARDLLPDSPTRRHPLLQMTASSGPNKGHIVGIGWESKSDEGGEGATHHHRGNQDVSASSSLYPFRFCRDQRSLRRTVLPPTRSSIISADDDDDVAGPSSIESVVVATSPMRMSVRRRDGQYVPPHELVHKVTVRAAGAPAGGDATGDPASWTGELRSAQTTTTTVSQTTPRVAQSQAVTAAPHLISTVSADSHDTVVWHDHDVVAAAGGALVNVKDMKRRFGQFSQRYFERRHHAAYDATTPTAAESPPRRLIAAAAPTTTGAPGTRRDDAPRPFALVIHHHHHPTAGLRGDARGQPPLPLSLVGGGVVTGAAVVLSGGIPPPSVKGSSPTPSTHHTFASTMANARRLLAETERLRIAAATDATATAPPVARPSDGSSASPSPASHHSMPAAPFTATTNLAEGSGVSVPSAGVMPPSLAAVEVDEEEAFSSHPAFRSDGASSSPRRGGRLQVSMVSEGKPASSSTKMPLPQTEPAIPLPTDDKPFATESESEPHHSLEVVLSPSQSDDSTGGGVEANDADDDML